MTEILKVCAGCPYGNSRENLAEVELRLGGVVSDPLAIHLDNGVPSDPFGPKVIFLASEDKTKIKVIGEQPSDNSELVGLNRQISRIDRDIKKCRGPVRKMLFGVKCAPIDGFKTPRPNDMDDEYLLDNRAIAQSQILSVSIKG